MEDKDESKGSDFILQIYNPIFQPPKSTKSKSNYKRITKNSTILSNKLHACTKSFGSCIHAKIIMCNWRERERMGGFSKLQSGFAMDT